MSPATICTTNQITKNNGLLQGYVNESVATARDSHTTLIMENNGNTDILIYKLIIKRRTSAAIYPEFGIWDAAAYYYPSKEAAEAKIREIGWEIDIYCFMVEAYPLGKEVNNRAYRRWLYDNEGRFISETLISELEDPKTHEPDELYPGRRQDQCRFKVGDIVEVMLDNTVTPQIVYMQPPDPERIAEIGKKCAENGMTNIAAEDYMEDSYITLKGGVNMRKYRQYDDSHHHAYVTDVLPPSLPIPNELKKRLRHLLVTVNDEQEHFGFDSDFYSPKETGLLKRVIIRTHATTPEPVLYYMTKDNEALTMTIDKEPQRIRGNMKNVSPEEFASIREWIKQNYDALMSHWNEPDSVNLCYRLKPFEPNNQSQKP